jgi:uncharacterized protein (TIGR02145 family)
VQDMKFGNLCNKTTFSGSNGADQTGKLSNANGYTGYYGDCRNTTESGAGYLYDWAAAIQKSGAYYGGSYLGCSGTSSGSSCQGICPSGWHIPTVQEFVDAHDKFSLAYGCSNQTCWNENSQWEGSEPGYVNQSGYLAYQGQCADYWSSTWYNAQEVYYMYYYGGVTDRSGRIRKDYGHVIRCVRN